MNFSFKFLLLCLVALSQVFSFEDYEPYTTTPDQAATLLADSETLVAGVVSPLSGQVALRCLDVRVRGAQDIELDRFFMPLMLPKSMSTHKYLHHQQQADRYETAKYVARNYIGWKYLADWRLFLDFEAAIVHLFDKNGISLRFQLLGPNLQGCKLLNETSGLSNTNGDSVGGQYDVRNTRVSYDKRSRKITVIAPEGTRKTYATRDFTTRPYVRYYLEKAELPNGKIQRHDYLPPRGQIKAMDPQEKIIYAQLDVQGELPHVEFKTSTGQKVYHRPEQHSIIGKYAKLETRHYDIKLPKSIVAVESPTYRHEKIESNEMLLLTHYEGKDQTLKFEYEAVGEPYPCYRVTKILAPEGNDFVPVYTLEYHPPLEGQKDGYTKVTASDGSQTFYQFDSNLLLSSIEWWGPDGTFRKSKEFSWTDNQWLHSVTLRKWQSGERWQKVYDYDRFGNPISEMITGDLTGIRNSSCTIKRAFSEDGKHLLLREEYEGGKKLVFDYLSNTNLPVAKYTYDRGFLVLQESWHYDASHNLVKYVYDDGIAKTLTRYSLRQEAPFIHLPEWVEESYEEKGEERLLKKRHLFYDSLGLISQEDIYDANNTFAYSLYRTYNERGDILTETNALGQTITHAYDAKGLKVSFVSPSNRLKTYQSYDARGRLIQKTESGEGTTHRTSFQYDNRDLLVQKSDAFDNITRFTHDSVIRKVTEELSPALIGEDGLPLEVTHRFHYDGWGRKIAQIDPNGHATTYQYNAYGNVTRVTYPDGSSEQHTYDSAGELEQSFDREGCEVTYTRDSLGRVLIKNYEDLAKETFSYRGLHLIQKTDQVGTVTHYTYDGAGRILEERCGEKCLRYTYDALGYVATRQEGGRTQQYTYDPLGRITEEKVTDDSGSILNQIGYTYDTDGNKIAVSHYNREGESKEVFAYDPFQRKVLAQDALGACTFTAYKENHPDAWGRKTLEVTTTDPKGIQAITTYDVLGNLVRHEVSHQGTTYSLTEHLYGPQGNETLQVDHIYVQGKRKEEQKIAYAYDPCNRLTSITRGIDSSHERVTEYSYTCGGRRETTTWPDGCSLHYSYDLLGFLEQVTSSDESLNQRFSYDPMGRLLWASDYAQNTHVERDLDSHGRILRERWSTGLSIDKTYDTLDRVTSLDLGQAGQVLYSYDPCYLRRASRLSSTEQELYAHEYTEYDPSGMLLSEHLLGNLGSKNQTFDAARQLTAIKSPYFTQVCHYDALGNVTDSIINNIPLHYTYDTLSQLTSEPGYAYLNDSLYNRREQNGRPTLVNELNELESIDTLECTYDLRGNITSKKTPNGTFYFSYDALNRLKTAKAQNCEVCLTYDPLDRLVSKEVISVTGIEKEHYLYHDDQEIGAFYPNLTPKNLKLIAPEPPYAPFGVELEGKVFAALADRERNIRGLVDPQNKKVYSYNYSAFGLEKVSPDKPLFNPWRYAGKRLDPELGLVYFGKRYYDPQLARWLTTDPAGFIDSTNLYQYLYNNPFKYYDPNGQFLQLLLIPLMEMTWEIFIVDYVIPAIITYATYAAADYASDQLNHGQHKSHSSPRHSAAKTKGSNPQASAPPGLVNWTWEGYMAALSEGLVGDMLEKRSSRPDPDPKAEGTPHTIIQVPGAAGSYTTHNGDGTYKQYRGSGQPHGPIPRPNVKETQNNQSPKGPVPGRPKVREPKAEEIPKGNRNLND